MVCIPPIVYIDGCTTRSQYYLGFTDSDGGTPDLSVVLSTTDLQPVDYFIYVPKTRNHYNGTVTVNNSVIVYLPSSLEITSYSHQDYGIFLETSSNKVTVIGRSYTSHTTDSYLALPVINSKTVTKHTYYAMSVYSSNSYSSILIVGTEDNTAIKFKFSTSFNVYMNYQSYYVYSYREYSFVINRLQTMYIYPYYNDHDLSGTRIVANKPISVFSGHRCAYVPYSNGDCGYLIEQIPPTIFWGKIHYVAPLATRRTYTLKVLAAYDNTRIIIYRNDSAWSTTLDEQGHTYITLDGQQYCAVHSNNDILVAQFSGNDGEDPSMGLVSATNNFASRFQFPVSTFRYSVYSPSFINIIVMAQYYQPDKIYMITDGTKKSLNTQIWIPIRVKNVVEAYATKIPVLPGVVEIIHANKEALMTTMVYGIDQRIGYIHPGGPSYSTISKELAIILISYLLQCVSYGLYLPT